MYCIYICFELTLRQLFIENTALNTELFELECSVVNLEYKFKSSRMTEFTIRSFVHAFAFARCQTIN